MVPTCSNSREHESSRARLMAHRVGDLLVADATREESQNTRPADKPTHSLIAGAWGAPEAWSSGTVTGSPTPALSYRRPALRIGCDTR